MELEVIGWNWSAVLKGLRKRFALIHAKDNFQSLLDGDNNGSEICAVALVCSEGLLNRVPHCSAVTLTPTAWENVQKISE